VAAWKAVAAVRSVRAQNSAAGEHVVGQQGRGAQRSCSELRVGRALLNFQGFRCVFGGGAPSHTPRDAIREQARGGEVAS
jgi:hypothetical protein